MKQAIIFATFGSADPIIRTKIIDAAANEIQAEFKNFEVRQAYTSNFMRRKLKSQGINVLTIAEQIDKLRAENFEKIIILPSHLTPGEEFEYKILPFAADDVKVLTPIFTANCDTNFDRRAFGIIVKCFKTFEDEQLVLIGHGSPHRHNPVYENLQKLADSSNLNVHIGVIEPNDTPNFDDVVNRLHNHEVSNILIAPLLFNGGVHVNNDIAGEDDNSWKSRLIKIGFNVRICTDGLGLFKEFRNLFIEKILKNVINVL